MTTRRIIVPRAIAALALIGAVLGTACAAPPTEAVAGASEEAPISAEGAPRPDERRFGLAQPRPRTPGSIRLAAYNVLNLFDHEDDPALTGRYDDAAMATKLERCRNLAAVIRKIDADVIALEEVESLETLTWFRDTFLPDAGYEHLASLDAGYYRGVENSVMSRFEIVEAKVWPGLSLDDVERPGAGWAEVPEADREGLTIQRSPLMVEIAVNDDYRLTLFVVHHKSGRDFRYKREAEAVRVLELIRGLDEPGRNIAVLGDFNAAPWDKSLRLYLEADFIDTLDHRVVKINPGADPEEARLYVTHESERIIDYVLLNSAAARELVIGSPHVYGTLRPPASYDWRRDPKPPGYASDHYPLIVDLVAGDR